MAHPSAFPARVLAIAVTLVVALALLVVAVNRLGRPAQPEAGRPSGGPPTAEPGAADSAAGVPEQAATPAADSVGAAGEASTAGDTVPTEQVTVQLYLIDTATFELVPRFRRIEAPHTTAAQAQAALEVLVRAGTPDAVSPLPPDTVIREVWVTNGGIAYVDLAPGFPKLLEQGSIAEIHAVYGMIGTLTASFPEIRLVQFLVGGEPVDTFTGHLDLSTPLGPLSDWLYR